MGIHKLHTQTHLKPASDLNPPTPVSAATPFCSTSDRPPSAHVHKPTTGLVQDKCRIYSRIYTFLNLICVKSVRQPLLSSYTFFTLTSLIRFLSVMPPRSTSCQKKCCGFYSGISRVIFLGTHMLHYSRTNCISIGTYMHK